MSASLDSSLDPMEEIRFRKKHSSAWTELQKETHFTFDELEQIMVIFFKIQKRDEKPAGSDLISRAHFRDVLHTGLGMTDAYMMERVMVALDRGTSPYVTMTTFAKALSLYMRGDLEERIAYAFTIEEIERFFSRNVNDLGNTLSKCTNFIGAVVEYFRENKVVYFN